MGKWVEDRGELSIKIAVVGQAGAGKIKILNQLAASQGQASVRTSMLSDAEVARTEFIWPERLPDGSFVRVKIFALSGSPMHQAAEQCLLTQADGVVYVVNCDPQTITASRASLLGMLRNAARVGVDWKQSAVVMQYNRANKYPNFKPSDLDGWLGLDSRHVSRHITSTEGDDLGVAVIDAAAKVVDRLSKELAEAG